MMWWPPPENLHWGHGLLALVVTYQHCIVLCDATYANFDALDLAKKLFFSSNSSRQECLCIVVDPAPRSAFPSTAPMLLLKNLTQKASKTSLFSEDGVLCAVTVISTEDPKNIQMVQGVKDNLLVLDYPKGSGFGRALASLQHPVIWRTKKNIYLNCPRYGRQSSPRKMKIGTCSSSLSCKLKYWRNSLPVAPAEASLWPATMCPSPVRGNTLVLSVSPSGPHLYKLGGRRGKMFGYSINAFLALAGYLKFNPKIKFSRLSLYNITSGTFTNGFFKEVLDGVADVSHGPQNMYLGSFFDIGDAMSISRHDIFKYVFVTRTPIPLNRIDNLWLPFSTGVWFSIVATNISLSVLLLLIHMTYSSDGFDYLNLVKQERSKFNFFLYPLAKLTEPDPLPWFRANSWSTGRVVTLLWSIFSVSIVLFYISNLRAYLITPRYERPLLTLADIVDNGKRVFMFPLPRHRIAALEEMGLRDTDIYRVVELAERSGGMFNPMEHGGLHRSAPLEMSTDRAVALLQSEAIPYLYLRDPLLARERMHVVEEALEYSYSTFITRKHSAGTAVLQTGTRALVESGIMDSLMTKGLSFRGILHSRPDRRASGSPSSSSSVKTFALENFYSAFLFFALGLTFSGAAFAWERARRRWRATRKKLVSSIQPEKTWEKIHR